MLAVGLVARRRGAEGRGLSDRFDLFVFSTDTSTIGESLAAGVRGVVVDWERVGKRHRQAGADTQIGEDTAADLARVRRETPAYTLCRIDNTPELLVAQIEEAIEIGVDELLVPMIRSATEVAGVLELVGGKCGVGILVETRAAFDELGEIAALPLSRAYVGLNDLAIDRRRPNIFEPLVDGTVDEIRAHFSVPFGIAGLTVVDRGAPIPCRLIVAELARLGCTFSFLRRSYHADIRGRDAHVEIPRLLAELERAGMRTAPEVEADRDALAEAVEAWAGTPVAL